jgi:hypothetical protein
MKTIHRPPGLFAVGHVHTSTVIALIQIPAWHSSDDLERWQRAATSHEDVGLECSWYSKRGDLSLLEWDNMPLTPDFQSYQELDKILEVVEFTFERGLSPVERKDFERRVYEFIRYVWLCSVMNMT